MLFIDLTATYKNRHRPHHGISRVESVLARALASHPGADPQFVRLRGERRHFTCLEDAEAERLLRGCDQLSVGRSPSIALPPRLLDAGRAFERLARVGRRRLLARLRGRRIDCSALLREAGPGHAAMPQSHFVHLGGNWEIGAALPILARHLGIWVLIHDTLPLDAPAEHAPAEVRAFRAYLQSAAACARGLFTASAWAEQRLRAQLARLGAALPRIERLSFGYDHLTTQRQRRPCAERHDCFALCLGAFVPRKNQAFLIEVWRRAQREGRDPGQLRLIGSPGHGGGDMYRQLVAAVRSDPWLKQRIVLVTDAGDAEVAWYLARARVALFPSVAEGWGLPIAEAVALGTPVIATAGSALGEVARGRALLLPLDTGSWLDALSDPARAHRAAAPGPRLPTWDDCAAQLIELIGSPTPARPC